MCVALPGGAISLGTARAQAAPSRSPGPWCSRTATRKRCSRGPSRPKGENVKITTFDTGFTAQKQFSVIQDIVAQHKYQGILVQAIDSVGIEPAIKQAIKAGIQVVTLNVPIGPSSTTMPSATSGPGRIGAYTQVTWGHQLGQMTENACKGINCARLPSSPVQIGTSGDDNMIAGFKSQVKGKKNIDVVAIQGGGGFLIGPSENVAKNLLVAHRKLSGDTQYTGDQMTHGAQLAVQAEGLSGKVKLIGQGASTYAIRTIRSGTWYRSVVTLPLSIGRIAMQVLYRHLQNPKLAPSAVDPAVFTKQNPLITKSDIGTFQAQWDR